MNPLVDKVGKRKQGSSDENAPWSKARMGWVTQLRVRLGTLTLPDDAPAQFKNLPSLNVTQIAFWDEMHKEQVIGYAGNRSYRFSVDANGKYDPNGKATKEISSISHLKYPQQGRLLLGVAAVKLLDGQVQGRRCMPYCYTGKTVVTIAVYNELMESEMRRVKSLKDGGPGWVQSFREPGVIYEAETLAAVKVTGMGKKTLEQLASTNIVTVGELKKATINQMQTIAKNKDNKLTSKALAHLQAHVQNAVPGDVPDTAFVDHRKANNPYLSRYGDAWKDEIKSTVLMKKNVCITELVEHIFKETKKVMRGTEHENNCYFYHDALSQMTNGDTKKWMKEQGYYDAWILPLNGLNAGTIYRDRPPGDSPECMPTDNSLNEEAHAGVRAHVARTILLMLDDPKKFSLATPKEIDRAYTRLFDPSLGPNQGIPCSRRIIEDCNKFVSSLEAIYDAKGTMVPGLGNRIGHRRENAVGISKSNHGGERKKQISPEIPWVHPDAIEAFSLFIDASKKKVSLHEVSDDAMDEGASDEQDGACWVSGESDNDDDDDSSEYSVFMREATGGEYY
jgi:hypothetical protein